MDLTQRIALSRIAMLFNSLRITWEFHIASPVLLKHFLELPLFW